MHFFAVTARLRRELPNFTFYRQRIQETSVCRAQFLSNRFQFVEYNGYVTSRANIMCGVPQGSMLGPLFFSALHQRYNQHVNNITTDIICR